MAGLSSYHLLGYTGRAEQEKGLQTRRQEERQEGKGESRRRASSDAHGSADARRHKRSMLLKMTIFSATYDALYSTVPRPIPLQSVLPMVYNSPLTPAHKAARPAAAEGLRTRGAARSQSDRFRG